MTAHTRGVGVGLCRYDSTPNREQLRKCRILSGISRKDAPNIQGMGKHR
jgi:hypothetical protein